MSYISDVFYLFYPKVCLNCSEELNKQEKVLCLDCRFDLPLTNFSSQPDNVLESTFYGRMAIEFGTALLYYNKSEVVKNLIHNLKYKGKQEIGTLFGEWLANELIESKRCPKFDYIVPVPLHKNRLKSRGYNQVTEFGKQLSKILKVPYNDSVLLRKTDTETQTSKQRFDRFKNMKEKFYINDTTVFKDKHILIVDDVITTGATIESCAIELQQTDEIKISVATIAFTA